MPEIKWDIQLSVTESNNIGEIKPRQNNSNSEVIRVKLTRNSEAYDLTALKVFFVTHFQNAESNGVNKLVQKEAKVIDAKKGIFEFIFDDDCMFKEGRQEAYFEVYDFDKFLDATQRFYYVVQPSSRKMRMNASSYIDTWENWEKKLEDNPAANLQKQIDNHELKKADVVYVDSEIKTKADKEEMFGKFNSLERQINDTKSGLIGEFDNEDQLKKKHPNGATGYALVTILENNEKVIYMYTWDGKNWKKGNRFNGMGLAENSANSTKRTIKGEKCFLILPPNGKEPSFLTSNQLFTFFKDTIICFQKADSANKSFYILDQDIQIDLSKVDSSTKVLRFNVDTKNILSGHYGTVLKENECLLTTGRVLNTNAIFDLGIPYKVNGRTGLITDDSINAAQLKDNSGESRKRTVKGEKIFLIAPGNGKIPNFDTKEKTLTLYADTIIYHQKFAEDKKVYHILIDDQKLDLATESSTTKIIIFNIDTKQFRVSYYGEHLKENECLLTTGRLAGVNATFDFGVQYTVNGKIPWSENEFLNISHELLLNSYDDYLRCGHHRGQNLEGPENTLAAYKLSKNQGTSIVEMDLNYTSDGIPVSLHDVTINRTGRNTDGSKIDQDLKITEMTFDEVRKYDFGIYKGDEFKGEKIPTFEEIIRLIKVLDMHLYIDRASLINTDERRAEIKRVLDKYDAWYDVTFMCVYSHADKLLELKPKLNFMYVADDFQEIGITELVRLKEKGATGRYMANAKNITDDQIKQIQSQDVDVEFWNCFEDTDYQKYIDMGVRGFQTDGYNFKGLISRKLKQLD